MLQKSRFSPFKAAAMLMSALFITGCQKTDNLTPSDSTASSDPLVGCYTVSHSEPAQIKITKSGDTYRMQMHQFNDPTKDWDKPESMQLLANDNGEIQKYFDIKAGENKFLEKVIARPDRVFVLAKVTDSFASINPQYDSPYLGYIYKGSNTVYKVSCSSGKVV